MPRSHETGRVKARTTLLTTLITLLCLVWLVLWAVVTCHAGEGLASTTGWTVAGTPGPGSVKWLRTPAGQPFYSKGVNCVTGWFECDKSREGKAYFWGNFYPSHEAWAVAAERDLTGWGFNTRGGWSQDLQEFATPYVVELDLGRAAELHWFDPFDPAMADKTYRIALELTAPYRNDPRLIGYFTDNEVGWWNAPIFRWYLKDPWTNHTKQVLWNLLHDTYGGNWKRLLADFVPDTWVKGWDELRETGARLRLRPGGQGIKVVDRFTYLVAHRYYGLVHDALKRAHPEALVLGDRLPLYYNQDAVLAARGLVDVLSTNYNVDLPDGWVAPYYFEGLDRLTGGTPVLVSEFFFAARENRSGNRNNGHLMTVDTQAERARGALAAMRAFASFPGVVGAHWFQLYDEPAGGRFDGEDFNMGLADVHDRPYEELTEGARLLNPKLDEVHAGRGADRGTDSGATGGPNSGPAEGVSVATIGDGATGTSGHTGTGPIRVARAAQGQAVDGSLAEWDHGATRLPSLTAPAPYVPFGDIHLAWAPEGLYLACHAKAYLDSQLLAMPEGSEFPLSEAFQVQLRAATPKGPRAFAIFLAPFRSEQFEDYLKTSMETKPLLFRLDGAEPAQDSTARRSGRMVPAAQWGGQVRELSKPLPHITFEAFIPARELGYAKLRPGQTLRLGLTASTYFRELTMGWPGPTGSGRTAYRTVVLDGSAPMDMKTRTVLSAVPPSCMSQEQASRPEAARP